MSNEEQLRFPDSAGLMVLPWVTLFPGGLLPLHIFEERYRHMLKDALGSQRMFAIAHLDDSVEENEEAWNPIGTVGVVRACVTNDDGTSNLILQGVARVEFSNNEPEPYPHANIEILRDSSKSSSEMEKLRAEILRLVKKRSKEKPSTPAGFIDHLGVIESPASFADMISSTMITNPIHRRELLAELDVCCRLELLADCLQDHEYSAPDSADGNSDD